MNTQQAWLKTWLFFIFIFSCFLAQAQQSGINFSGLIIDAQSKAPVPYATVLVKADSAENMLTGATTDELGRFRIQTDSKDVYLEVSFIGYTTKTIRDFSVEKGIASLGEIMLEQDVESLNEVEVTAERSSVEFKLDKRVFNVGKDISSTGMGAMEVLDNVPSVNVNIEGQVTLRGNSGVQILINGKPSVLADEGSNALGTITADMIDQVEVITNPSAKYEAGGTSGIINIVLKKEEKKGLNGSVSVNTGIPDNHSVGVSINKRTAKLNLFTQFGAGYRSLPSFTESVNLNRLNGAQIRSDGTEYRNENFYNFTLGTDYYINELNVITLSGNFALELEDQPSEINFSSFENTDSLVSQWVREETTTATNPKYQYDLQYKRDFKNKKDHNLLFSTQGSFFGKDLSSEFVNTPLFGTEISANQRTETNFYKADYTFKLDYTNPITEQITVETGGLYTINDVGNDFKVSNLENQVWVVDSGLTNNFEWVQKVLGVYATGAYESQKWGLQVGLRAENTDLRTRLTTTNENNNQQYTNLFPSAHTSYKFSKLISVQAGYSRRIYRPGLWQLNPFFNIRNNFNIRQGNPDLQPEFADSYEVSGIFVLPKASINASVYHLYTTEKIERISTFVNNVNINMPMNIGSSRKTGIEMNGKYTPLKWFTLNGDANYGIFIREGQFEDQDFDFQGDQWSSRATGKFQLPSGFDLEVSGRYESRVQTVQGMTSGFASMDLGLRKKLWKGKAIVNASVRDLFASRIRENIIDRSDFYLYSFSQRGRFITLGFSYSFGKGEAMTYSGRRR